MLKIIIFFNWQKNFAQQAIRIKNTKKSTTRKLSDCRKGRHTQPYLKAGSVNDFIETSFTDLRGPTEKRKYKLCVVRKYETNDQAIAA